MAVFSDRLNCCGIVDCYLADEWDGAYHALQDLWQDRPSAPIIVLSDVVVGSRAMKVVKMIRKHRLGRVVSTSIVHNPNSGCKIHAFLWVVNWTNLDRLATKRKWGNGKKKKVYQ